MREAIMAAAGQAADAALGSGSGPMETPQRADTGEAAAQREAAARAAGEAEGLRQGRASERARIGAIIGSDQAKGREDLAGYFAFETDMAADVVLAALAKSPSGKGGLDGAMAREAQPRLGPGGDHLEAAPRVISTADVYARRRAAVAAAPRS